MEMAWTTSRSSGAGVGRGASPASPSSPRARSSVTLASPNRPGPSPSGDDASPAPDAGDGYELEAIAAVVIGGTSISGGAGGILKTLAGVLLLGVLSNLLVLAGQSYEIQRIATGLIIVLAIAFDVYRRRSPK